VFCCIQKAPPLEWLPKLAKLAGFWLKWILDKNTKIHLWATGCARQRFDNESLLSPAKPKWLQSGFPGEKATR